MNPEEIKLRLLEAVIAKAPQDFDATKAIQKAEVLAAYVTLDNPPKRGPGRPPKQTPTNADNG